MPDTPSELEHTRMRVDELETRIAFLEETIDSLNTEVARLSRDFLLAHQAMQHMNRRLEQLAERPGNQGDPGIEPPPPHY